MDGSNPGKKQILVADGAVLIRTALKLADDTDAKEAADGHEALAICQQRRIDLIISNWHMPKMNGLELLKSHSRR